ncbi:MAG TPA: class I SAM-dependent methyltransferase [Vicinamibacteria bacterium]|nr:class I SAM-dependent methyltransferase [Vicinamibacteria bacterium]
MGLYEKYLLPRIVHLACGSKPAMKQRAKVVPLAEGRVLEIGVGSGLNLPFYTSSKVEHVWGLDPSRDMWALAQKKPARPDLDFEFIPAPAEKIPLDDRIADTVLTTYTLCTIPDVGRALGEMSRVLKPEGKLLFCEHGQAPDENVRKWQDRMNPLWKKLGGGCNLNRPISELIEQSGFKIRDMETMYIPGWRPACFNYWGTAVLADRCSKGPFILALG